MLVTLKSGVEYKFVVFGRERLIFLILQHAALPYMPEPTSALTWIGTVIGRVSAVLSLMLTPGADKGGSKAFNRLFYALVIISVLILVFRAPGCTEKERYWYRVGEGDARHWLEGGAFGSDFESPSDETLNGIADRCGCPVSLRPSFKKGYMEVIEESNKEYAHNRSLHSD